MTRQSAPRRTRDGRRTDARDAVRASNRTSRRDMSRVDEGAIVVPDVKHKIFTLVMVRDYERGRVLLGEKLRGFGTGCVVETSSREMWTRAARGARVYWMKRAKRCSSGSTVDEFEIARNRRRRETHD